MEYVVGFLFAPDGRRVLLIEKNRPARHRGLLNGVGGRINPDETPPAAMAREFHEEAGVEGLDWEVIATLDDGTRRVHFFSATSKLIDAAQQLTDERLTIIPVRDLQQFDLVPNLHVLIPLALDDGFIRPVQFNDRPSSG